MSEPTNDPAILPETLPEIIPADLIPTAEAVRLIPGRRRGRSIHLGTLYRWLDRGWLRGYYVGGLLKVSVAELRRLLRVRPPKAPRPGRGAPGMTHAQEARLTADVLARHGMTLPPAPAEGDYDG